MSSAAVRERISVMDAQVEALLAEPVDGLSAAERVAVAYQWETLVRRMDAVRHRLVAAIAELPRSELGDSSPAPNTWPSSGEDHPP